MIQYINITVIQTKHNPPKNHILYTYRYTCRHANIPYTHINLNSVCIHTHIHTHDQEEYSLHNLLSPFLQEQSWYVNLLTSKYKEHKTHRHAYTFLHKHTI